MTRLRPVYQIIATALAAMALMLWPHVARTSSSAVVTDAASISASICPIVYPLDQFASAAGQRYNFFGNAFFINEDGYLITAAHVVRAFRDGGQPYILVGSRNGTHRLLQATLVAADWGHDVAVLRATPNPFTGNSGIRFLPLTIERPARGRSVMLLSLHPSDPETGDTSEQPLEDRVSGQVLDYQFTHTQPQNTDSELLVVSQPVVPGQSGSPVIDPVSKEVVGVVLGHWLRSDVILLANSADPTASSPGAVLRIHYAIALLRERGIAWHSMSDPEPPQGAQPDPQQGGAFSPPTPLSLVATPYPPQALFGGEVVLDALIDADGKLEELNVVRGQPPFLDPVVSAVHTWSFEPARLNGRAVEARLGIVFQFPQSFVPPLTAHEHTYEDPAESADRSAAPVFTSEPSYPPTSVVQGDVALYVNLDQNGQVTSTHVLRDLEPLTARTDDAVRMWRFVPARQGGANADSAVVVVDTFRRPAVR